MRPPASEWTQAAPASRRRAAWLVLGLHVLGLLVWLHHSGRLTLSTAAPRSAITLRWVPPSPDVPAAPTVPAVKIGGTVASVAARPLTLPSAGTEPRAAPDPAKPSATAPETVSSTLTLLPAASAPQAAEPSSTAMGALLRSDATRQAVRQTGQQPLLAERSEAATGIAIQRRDTALAEQVKDSAKGDCAKGEFAGAGMGLLSLPALAYAAAAGQCAK